MALFISRRAGRLSSAFRVVVTAALVLAAACAGHRVEEVPYSLLKQHIANGDVREVVIGPVAFQIGDGRSRRTGDTGSTEWSEERSTMQGPNSSAGAHCI
jgi:hypothetical protein